MLNELEVSPALVLLEHLGILSSCSEWLLQAVLACSEPEDSRDFLLLGTDYSLFLLDSLYSWIDLALILLVTSMSRTSLCPFFELLTKCLHHLWTFHSPQTVLDGNSLRVL